MDIVAEYDELIKLLAATQGYLSVPYIQLKGNMPYRRAAQMVSYAICRRWVNPEPTGVRYTFRTKSFSLKSITAKQAKIIGEDLSRDATRVLSFLSEQKQAGFETILDKVDNDEEDMRNALLELLQWELIISFNHIYYINVSASGAASIKREHDQSIKSWF